MGPRDLDDLDRSILSVLAAGGGRSPGWLRFVARVEAARLGRSPGEAERALGRLHERGYLSLAFGFERGSLSARGVVAAGRVGSRPAGYLITGETGPSKPSIRAS